MIMMVMIRRRMVMVMISICDDNDDDNGHSMTVIHGHIYKRPAYIIHTIIQLEALIAVVLSSEHIVITQ